MIARLQKLLGQWYVTMARNRTSVNAVRQRWRHHDPDGDCDFRSVKGLTRSTRTSGVLVVY